MTNNGIVYELPCFKSLINYIIYIKEAMSGIKFHINEIIIRYECMQTFYISLISLIMFFYFQKNQ